MANFLFWNMAWKPLASEVATLCEENDIDVVVLAESNLDTKTLLLALNANATRIYTSPPNASSRLQFFTRYSYDALTSKRDEGGISVRVLRPPVGVEVLLIAVHLPSKLHWTENEQSLNAARLGAIIREVEEETGNRNSVLVGDFNMSPFEAGMVSADGVHGVMDKELARAVDREVSGQSRSYFYNPMWSRLGDESEGPPGTYFMRGGMISHFWHTFDQVLFRPSLLDFYSGSALKVVTKIGATDLLKTSGQIDRSLSDHLPLVFGLSIERGV